MATPDDAIGTALSAVLRLDREGRLDEAKAELERIRLTLDPATPARARSELLRLGARVLRHRHDPESLGRLAMPPRVPLVSPSRHPRLTRGLCRWPPWRWRRATWPSARRPQPAGGQGRCWMTETRRSPAGRRPSWAGRTSPGAVTFPPSPLSTTPSPSTGASGTISASPRHGSGSPWRWTMRGASMRRAVCSTMTGPGGLGNRGCVASRSFIG